MAIIFQTNHDMHNQASMLETMRVSYIISKCYELWYTNDCHFCILLHCQALQTEVSKWNSTKLCQMVDS